MRNRLAAILFAFTLSACGFFGFDSTPVDGSENDTLDDPTADEQLIVDGYDIRESFDLPVDVQCSSDEECEDFDPCTVEYCNIESGLCYYSMKDEDNDGHIPVECGGSDCDDSQERINPDEQEICSDEIDNDCDELIDCQEPECLGTEGCPCADTEATCDDGVDNDCDGSADCEDSDCAHPCACNEPPCETGLTCCSIGCCDTTSNVNCCGGCGITCSGRNDMCCSGICAGCCDDVDCNDDSECTVDSCVLGTCSNIALDDGTPCGDGMICCGGECSECCGDDDCDAPYGRCCEGICQECCEDAECEDSDPCTDDMCDDGSCFNGVSPDMTDCGFGVCCDGECRAGGECCTDSDCGDGCSGTAQPCESLDASACDTQTGCRSGGIGGCSGTMDCSGFTDETSCEACGCQFTWGRCRESSGSNCSSLTDATTCTDCGCTWTATCTGMHPPCSFYPNQSLCNSQLDCHWSTCSDYQCT